MSGDQHPALLRAGENYLLHFFIQLLFSYLNIVLNEYLLILSLPSNLEFSEASETEASRLD